MEIGSVAPSAHGEEPGEEPPAHPELEGDDRDEDQGQDPGETVVVDGDRTTAAMKSQNSVPSVLSLSSRAAL